MNGRGAWTTREEFETHSFDQSLCDGIVKMYSLYNVKTIVDIGCGDGSYVKYLKNAGFKCLGYDASHFTPFPYFKMDFSEPQDIGKFDLVLSLEVGEHIPKEYEDVYLDNLVRASKSLIVMSWAIPGQEGAGHVNCQDNAYIIKQMRHREWELDVEETRYLRGMSTVPWFANTLMVFHAIETINMSQELSSGEIADMIVKTCKTIEDNLKIEGFDIKVLKTGRMDEKNDYDLVLEMKIAFNRNG